MQARRTLSDLILDCADLYGEQLSDARLQGYLRALGNLDLEELKAAIDAHVRDSTRGRWFPKPADIIHQHERQHGHPSADVAWSIALQSFDEGASVVWSAEIAKARNIALSVWESGDKIGARMAFRSAYESIVQNTDQRPVWSLSIGTDASRRSEAVRDAVAAGLISNNQAKQLLPPEAAQGVVGDIAGLIAGKSNVVEFPPTENGDETVRARSLANISQILGSSGRETWRQRKERERRERVEAEKAKVQAFMDGEGNS